MPTVDSILYNSGLGAMLAGSLLITPTGGTQDLLANLLPGPQSVMRGATLALGGAQIASSAILSSTSSYTQTGVDTHANDFLTTASYSGDSAGGANLGVVSTLIIMANGHHYSATHSAAYYGVATLGDTNAASVVDFISGVQAAATNGGAGTLTAAAAFRAHASGNTGGGSVGTYWGFFQEDPGAGTNRLGSSWAGPVSLGFGLSVPTYGLDIQTNATNFNSANGFRLRMAGAGAADVVMTSTGSSVGLGAKIGAGSFAATEIVSSTGNALATTDVTGFIYLAACAGAPTGVPTHNGAGLIPVVINSTDKKIAAYIAGSWVQTAALT